MRLRPGKSNLQKLRSKKKDSINFQKKVTCFSTDEIFFALNGLHDDYQNFKKESPALARQLTKNKYSLNYLKKLLKKISQNETEATLIEDIIAFLSCLLNTANKLRSLLLIKYLIKLPAQQTHQIFSLNYKSYIEHS